MKTKTTIFVFLLIFCSCSKNSNLLSPTEKINYRSIAYASLSNQEKESLIKDWKDAKIYQGFYQKKNQIHTVVIGSEDWISFILYDPNFILINNQKLVTVLFNTDNDALLGPIIIIVDPDANIAIGSALRL